MHFISVISVLEYLRLDTCFVHYEEFLFNLLNFLYILYNGKSHSQLEQKWATPPKAFRQELEQGELADVGKLKALQCTSSRSPWGDCFSRAVATHQISGITKHHFWVDWLNQSQWQHLGDAVWIAATDIFEEGKSQCLMGTFTFSELNLNVTGNTSNAIRWHRSVRSHWQIGNTN